MLTKSLDKIQYHNYLHYNKSVTQSQALFYRKENKKRKE